MAEFKVLIVDDSPFMRRVFSDVVDADPAFKVLATASNGIEAVDLALKLKPDIITMDLEMPQMNGLEALQRIMEILPIPIIMLSAVTDNGTRDTIKALQYGALDFIRKPDGAVKLDIVQVGVQLLEKLRIALETMNSGSFRMLPAVEEKAEPLPSLHEPDINVAVLPLQEEKRVHSIPLKQTLTKAITKPIQPVIDSAKSIEKLPKAPLAPAARELLKPHKPLKPLKPFKPSPLAESRTPVESELVMGTKLASTAVDKLTPKRTPKALPPTDKRSQEKEGTKSNQTSTTFSHLVAIGTSTGGPRALHEVLTGIPADYPAPILVVQHMPPKFTHSLAQRLDNFCSIHVREAVDGEGVESATAYIAPGGYHMSLAKDNKGLYRIKLTQEGPRSGHMPSVDVLFESLLGQQQLKRHIVLMTGMGSDGAKGMKALQEDGAMTTIAEAENTCVVYGMPRSAVELEAVSHLLPLQQIAPKLVQEVMHRIR
jgi:two-component system chemotaxis response regulator CheB